MSVLGINEIHKRIKNQSLVKNIGKRELENPEGVGVDLRLGSVHKIIKGGAFIEVDGQKKLGSRMGIETKEIASYKENEVSQEWITIKPREYYLVQTFEEVNTPSDLMPLLHPRTSLFRSGLLLLNSKTDPGYVGKLTMGLTNLSPFPVRLQLGARICNLIFHKIEGKSVKYRGQHQGGRISPKKVEKQV
jgi:deoxycytidine triphosphate deaminase